MKYRAIGVFILLAAALIFAPKASEELLTLKNSLSSRMRAEILHAFLNMHGGAEVREEADGSSVMLLTSSDESVEEMDETGVVRVTVGSSATSERRAASSVEDQRLAMIVEPELDLRPMLPDIEKIEAEVLLPRVTKWEKRAMQEMAMILPQPSFIPNLATALNIPFVNSDGKGGHASSAVEKAKASYTFEEIGRKVEKAHEASEVRERFEFTVKLNGEKVEVEDAACDADEKARKARRRVQVKTAAPAPAPLSPVKVETRNPALKAPSNSFDVQFVTIGE